LPVASAYGLMVWLASGLVSHRLWGAFACFVVATYLMVELNNRNALLRISSRMVSVSFIALSMMMPFTMGATRASIAGLCFIMAMFVMLFSYQDRLSMGKTFYTFALLSLGSIFEIHLLYYIPVLWLSMAFHLQTMSWRTFSASILGVLTPYWFASIALFVVDDPWVVVKHFTQLIAIPMPPDHHALSLGQLVVVAWVVVLEVIGSVHFVRNSYMDSIRIRMIFNTFIMLSIFSTLLLIAMPSLFDMLIRVLIISTSPLIAHFLSLTHTRVTNIAFITISVVTLAITAFNLWTHLFPY